MSYEFTSTILGFFIAGIILWLIRRDLLHSRHAAWWLIVAISIVLLGIFPTAIDWLATHLGVHYPPTLLFVLGMGFILIKVITIDLHNSDLERKVRRLAQRLAMLEAENQIKPKND
jgi:hypothetical protein